MLNCPARLSVSRPKTVIVTVLVLLNAAAAHGSHVGDRLADVGFLSTSSESIRAADLLSQRFHAGKSNLVILDVHQCIGIHFATIVVRVVLHHLLRDHRIELRSGYTLERDVTAMPAPTDGFPVLVGLVNHHYTKSMTPAP